jgi:hypothetical protein
MLYEIQCGAILSLLTVDEASQGSHSPKVA